MNIKVGDKIKVITGKYKGTLSEVIRAFPKTNKVLIRDVNIQTKHIKPKRKGEQGQTLKEEAPIHVSNVALIDPKTKKPTRIKIKVVDGKKIRVSSKNNTEIV